MSTRSLIGLENPDGTVMYIYCHYDGYPEHNGKILKDHYNEIDKVRELVNLGDLSALGQEIGKKQDFNNRETINKNWCLAYGRDRGEKNTEAKSVPKEEFLHSRLNGEDYKYLFTEDGKWEYYPGWCEL